MRISESKLRGVIRGVLFEMYGGHEFDGFDVFDDHSNDPGREARNLVYKYGMDELNEDELRALRKGYEEQYFGEDDIVARNVDDKYSLCVIVNRDEIVGSECACVDVMNPGHEFYVNCASLGDLVPVSIYLR